MRHYIPLILSMLLLAPACDGAFSASPLGGASPGAAASTADGADQGSSADSTGGAESETGDVLMADPPPRDTDGSGCKGRGKWACPGETPEPGGTTAVCGNGIVEGTETCDGNCPATCTAPDSCTVATLSGDSKLCDAACSYEPLTACVDADGCCPSGCDATTDSDCDAGGEITAPLTLSQSFGKGSVRALAVDDAGNTYLAGYFYDTIDLGGALLTSAGVSDIFVAGYDAAGNHLFSRSFGGSSYDSAKDIALTPDGDIVVTGIFKENVDFGGGALSSNGQDDIFVLRLDATGGHLSSHGFGGSTFDEAGALTVDDQGAVYLTGYVQGAVDFGAGTTQSVGDDDLFLVKFDANDDLVFSRRFGGAGNTASGSSIALDPAGNILIAGTFYGTVNLGGAELTSAGYADIFVAKYDANGDHVFSKGFGDTLLEGHARVATDADANVYLTGSFRDSIDLGGGSLTTVGFYDIFLAKFDASGNHVFSDNYGGISADAPHGIAVDDAGRVILTGTLNSEADLGGGSLGNEGSYDVFVASFDTDGNHLASRGFGSIGIDHVYGLDVDAAGGVYITGDFEGTIDFGDGPLDSGVGPAIFLAKLAL